MELKDKVAIVTGASRGIGRAIALSLAREGATVIIAARTEKQTKHLQGTIYTTADMIRLSGGTTLPIKTDVTDCRDIKNLIDKAVYNFKRIDILVNNAATNRPSDFMTMPQKHWDMILNVNLGGAVLCTKAVLPIMKKQECGHIINISSIVTKKRSHTPMTGIAYDVSKAALNRFTIGLSEEMKDHHIAVNALLPDNTRTEGWALLNPYAKKNNWLSPDIWGDYCVFVATRNPATFTGNILTKEDLDRNIRNK